MSETYLPKDVWSIILEYLVNEINSENSCSVKDYIELFQTLEQMSDAIKRALRQKSFIHKQLFGVHTKKSNFMGFGLSPYKHDYETKPINFDLFVEKRKDSLLCIPKVTNADFRQRCILNPDDPIPIHQITKMIVEYKDLHPTIKKPDAVPIFTTSEYTESVKSKDYLKDREDVWSVDNNNINDCVVPYENQNII